jgi:hypothetical protein
MPSVQGFKNGTIIIRITLFVRWGKEAETSMDSSLHTAFGVIVVALHNAPDAVSDPSLVGQQQPDKLGLAANAGLLENMLKVRACRPDRDV